MEALAERGQRRAADQRAGAPIERVGDVPLHFLPRARVDQRPLVARPVQSVTDAQGADALREPRREGVVDARLHRSEEQTSEIQSLMRISYDVFCLKKQKN